MLTRMLGKGKNWSKMSKFSIAGAFWETCAYFLRAAQPLLRQTAVLLRNNQEIGYRWFPNVWSKQKLGRDLEEYTSVHRYLPLCTKDVSYPRCFVPKMPRLWKNLKSSWARSWPPCSCPRFEQGVWTRSSPEVPASLGICHYHFGDTKQLLNKIFSDLPLERILI